MTLRISVAFETCFKSRFFYPSAGFGRPPKVMFVRIPPAIGREKSLTSGRSQLFCGEWPSGHQVKIWLVLAILHFSVFPVDAGLAYWGSKGFVTNTDSRNRAWTPDFSMTLGVFNIGFTPTFENREHWCANWTQLGLAVYDTEESRFAGIADLSKPLPALVDPQVYFWAKNGEDLTKGPEWVLLTRAEWRWPSTSSNSNPALTWTTDDSVSVILGQAGQQGHHLTSTRVAPEPIPQTRWLAQYLGNAPNFTTPEADPDGDGLSNQLEYFLGSNPNDGSSRISPTLQTHRDTTQLTLQRNPYASSDFVVECSSNLLFWSKLSPERLQDRPDLIEVTIPHDSNKEAAFFRFGLTPLQR
jgi:hypothetical protein